MEEIATVLLASSFALRKMHLSVTGLFEKIMSSVDCIDLGSSRTIYCRAYDIKLTRAVSTVNHYIRLIKESFRPITVTNVRSRM